MNRAVIARELLMVAKSLMASAGPLTLLEELKSHIKDLDDDHYLSLLSQGWGHTPGADYIFGSAGSEITSTIIGFNVGNYTKEQVIKTVKQNIDKAIADNQPFKGMQGGQMETHKLWMKLMKDWKKRGYKSAKLPWDNATERHFQQWLDRSVHDDEREEVEQGIRQLVEDDPSLMDGAGHSWPELRDMVRRARIARRRKADSGDVPVYFNIGGFFKGTGWGSTITAEQSKVAEALLDSTVTDLYSEFGRLVRLRLRRKFGKREEDAGLALK